MAYEISRIVFTCPNDSLVGDAVYISGVKTVSYADVDDTAKHAIAIIKEKISATTCILSGRKCVIGGLTGLTTGNYYYLTNTATAGNTISLVVSAFLVGIAISTIELSIELDADIDVTNKANWNSDNSAITRYYTIGGRGLQELMADDGSFNWLWDNANAWIESTTIKLSTMSLNLLHGSTVTALRVTMQHTVMADLYISINRYAHSTGVNEALVTIMATPDMSEVSHTDIDYELIDNDNYSYVLTVEHSAEVDECRIRAVQIDYTVVRPN